jgi:hypothetical protein
MAALTYKDPHQLKPRARNPRTHSAKTPFLNTLGGLCVDDRPRRFLHSAPTA